MCFCEERFLVARAERLFQHLYRKRTAPGTWAVAYTAMGYVPICSVSHLPELGNRSKAIVQLWLGL